jgi:hypothetical protein
VTQNADYVGHPGTPIQSAESGVIHLLDPDRDGEFPTRCGRNLEWGFYAIGESVSVIGFCEDCWQLSPNGRSEP